MLVLYAIITAMIYGHEAHITANAEDTITNDHIGETEREGERERRSESLSTRGAQEVRC